MAHTEKWSEILASRSLIEHTHIEATTYGLDKFAIRERNFIQSIFDFSRSAEFNGLSEKQTTWLTAIAQKLNQTKGKYQYQVIAERNRSKFAAMRRSYVATCYGH